MVSNKQDNKTSLFPKYVNLKVSVLLKDYTWLEGIMRKVSQYEVLIEANGKQILIPKSNILYVVLE